MQNLTKLNFHGQHRVPIIIRILTETMHDMDGIRQDNNLGLPEFSSPFQVCL